jgi:hypothetical protein
VIAAVILIEAAVTILIEAAVTITVAVEGTAAVTVDEHLAALEALNWREAGYADEVPIAWDKVSVVVVAGLPDVSWTRAGGHIGHLLANADSKLCGLG